MKNLLKQQKGITLIALVITIIVLLILAGVTISMLSGENGILSRATETRGQNAYSSACEQVRLAYMTVKTEIMTQKVKDSSYNAQTNGENLATLVGKELKGTEWSTPSAPTYNTTSKAIEITYTNSSLKENMVAQNKPKESGKITFQIILQPQDAGLKIDGYEVTGGNSNPTDPDPTPSGAILPAGEYTVGKLVTVGGEEFFVLEDQGSTVKLLAKYCLNRAGTSQINEGSDVYGRRFSKTSYWDDVGVDSWPFDLQTSEMIAKAQQDGDADEGVPNAIIAAQSYGTAKGATEGRLLTFDEAEALDSAGGIMGKILYGQWTISDNLGDIPIEGYLDTWIGYAAYYSTPCSLSGDGEYIGSNYSTESDSIGVRPVLIMAKDSELDSESDRVLMIFKNFQQVSNKQRKQPRRNVSWAGEILLIIFV